MPAKNKKNSFYKLPIYLIIFAIALASFKFVTDWKSNINGPRDIFTKVKENVKVGIGFQEPPSDWKEYNNTEFRFVLKIPPLLLERKYKDQNEYVQFIKFSENRYSKHKGVGLGITKRSIEEELQKVKEEIAKDTNEAPTEIKIKVDNHDAVKLEYNERGYLEARSIVVVNGNNITISVSTVPDQIGYIIESIKFY